MRTSTTTCQVAPGHRRSRLIRPSAVATLIALLLTVSALAAFAHGRRHHRHGAPGPNTILAFGTMYGVDEAFLGAANAIRGVEGDELPWEVAGSAQGTLSTDGRLRIRVRGLVFTDDPEVPPELRGKNDEAEFRALVSCLTENETGGIETANVTTSGFPATESGDSDIDARIDLPNPCVAPIVFVLAGSEDKWFAVTGFESEEED